MSGLRPGLRHLLNFVATLSPGKAGPIARYYDELYSLLEGALEWHCLSRYSASFAENFYGLKRVAAVGGALLSPQERWRSLLLLVLVPYLRHKLDAAHARLQRHLQGKAATGTPMDRLLRALVAVYPYVWTGVEASSLFLQLAYITNRSSVHSPWLWLAGARLERLSEAEALAQSEAGYGASSARGSVSLGRRLLWLLGRLGRGALLLLSRILGLGLFLVQFLDWWHNSAEVPSSSLSLSALTTTIPPAPKAPSAAGNVNVLSLNPGHCPICRRPRRNDTLLTTSGYVFCYACIFRHLEADRRCPVTSRPATKAALVRLFFPH